MNIPKERRYTQDHEWTSTKDNTATVGITEFAVEQLGDITLVELPEVGDSVSAGDTVGVIESVKAVSDLYSPLSGTITKVNTALEDAPEQVNEDPYGQGWIFEIQVDDTAQMDTLLDANAYKSHLSTLEE
ncbi:MAG: glycine cleavage system protein GcvH [Myxococcota bacterium]|nr:glycine cleavage system protein GcvH [Myxococcota bacterium]